jgi:hypothetical protein
MYAQAVFILNRINASMRRMPKSQFRKWTQKPWRSSDFHATIKSDGLRLKTGSLKYFPDGFLCTARNAIGAGHVRRMRFFGNCQRRSEGLSASGGLVCLRQVYPLQAGLAETEYFDIFR